MTDTDWIKKNSVKELETIIFDKKTETFIMTSPDGQEVTRLTAEQAARFARAVKAILGGIND